jgi:hypothetical protein
MDAVTIQIWPGMALRRPLQTVFTKQPTASSHSPFVSDVESLQCDGEGVNKEVI